jgi:peroxiredoxin
MKSIFRRWCELVALAVAGLVLLLPGNLRADAASEGPATLVGKPAPELSFIAFRTNNKINLADYRGRMVVVDFFKAEGSDDYTGFDDVADVEKDDARKGVVVLGLSMDLNMPAVVALYQKKPNIDWPVAFDSQGFSAATAVRWKASRKTGENEYEVLWHVDYVVSPDGMVLWAGPPEELSRAVDDELKDHKPQLVDPAVMADAKDALDKTQAAITANNIGEAFHDRMRVPQAALADDDFAAEVKDTDDKLQTAGDAALADVDPLIASKDYVTAVAKLKDLSDGADGTPLGEKAHTKLIALQQQPDVRAAMQTAIKNAHADEALKVAQKLQEDKRDVAAYGRFKAIVKNFPESPAAKTAADAIAAYDADPEFKKKLAAAPTETPAAAPAADKPDAGRAKSLLSLANSYRDAGNYDTAREKYQSVIAQFPGTPEADAAKDELAKLPQ